jgi:hypothetical protein
MATSWRTCAICGKRLPNRTSYERVCTNCKLKHLDSLKLKHPKYQNTINEIKKMYTGR